MYAIFYKPTKRSRRWLAVDITYDTPGEARDAAKEELTAAIFIIAYVDEVVLEKFEGKDREFPSL